MSRYHLFEWSNQSWLPDAWRRYTTEYLQFMLVHGPFDNLRGLLGEFARKTDGPVVDLCSGSGGPWPSYLSEPTDELADVEVLLTDRFPDAPAFEHAAEQTDGRVRGSDRSVDARDVPHDLEGPRTIVNGFHNFRPDDARAILTDAVERGVPIAIFEIMDRRAATLLPLVLVPLFVLLATPFVRPFRWGRFFWTYLVPVMPFLIFWDGLVSALRTYSPPELDELVDGLETYDWEIDTTPAGGPGPARITYLIGTPK